MNLQLTSSLYAESVVDVHVPAQRKGLPAHVSIWVEGEKRKSQGDSLDF